MPIKTNPLPPETDALLRKHAAHVASIRADLAEALSAMNHDIVAAYNAGGGLLAIADPVGLTKARVHQIVKDK